MSVESYFRGIKTRCSIRLPLTFYNLAKYLKAFAQILLIWMFGALVSTAQPLISGLGTEMEQAIARIDTNTLSWRNKLYPQTDPGELNVYGFDPGDIPVYSDSVYALRLSLLETEIPLPYNEQVRAYIDLYANRKRNLVSKILTTSKFYFPIFEEVFDRERVPIEFKYLAVIESALNQKAISPVGAAGLWQFMAPTGRMYGLRSDSYLDERKEIISSTEAAVKYFKNSYAIYGDWLLVIASYNCGPGNVAKAIRRSGGKRDFWEIMPYLPRETRGYVPAFIAAAYVMNYASAHNIYPSEDQINFHLDTVIVDNRFSLEQIALASGISPEEIKAYNPSLRRGYIPFSPKGVCLTLPYNQAMKVARLRIDTSISNSVGMQMLAYNRPAETRAVSSGRVVYKVRRGDQLATIARRYDVSISDLRKWNKKSIKGNKILKGQRLTIYPNRA